MNLIIEGIISLMGLILVLGCLFFPFMVSFSTGNWWYCFLFTISWIPACFIATIIKGILT